ncbi:GNAT family N-acetyltransferase [Knoellia locipacati]|uniref:GNAT family N-acetyltransferase n=1 Tax=Knoellia locipacati TaxID=882824 RepID=UPI00384C7783
MTRTSAGSRRSDPYRNFNFRVSFEGRPVAGASTASGLKRASKPVRQHLSGREPEPGAVTMERGVSHDADFVAWAGRGSEGGRRELTIEVHDAAGEVATAYRLSGCWVSEFEALPDLDADAHAVRIEHLRLEHDGVEAIDVTPGPITSGLEDASGRPVTLRLVGDDWRAVADVRPTDAQREFVFPMAARYLLMTEKGGPWTSLGIYAGEQVVGHVMWGLDDDGSHWIGGLVVDQAEQGRGLGRATTRTLMAWFEQLPGHWTTRLTHHPANTAAARLYADLGFTPTGEVDEDGEVVLELLA